MQQPNTFSMSAGYYSFAFENPTKCKPVHGALYHFIIHHNNKMGWVEQFGLPTDQTMAAISVKNYKTYINALLDLAKWKFITMIERSKNQWTSNIIALVKITKATTKALPKALSNQEPKQAQSTAQSIVSINKLVNLETNKLENLETVPSFSQFPNPTFESLFAQHLVEQKRRVNTLDREAIISLGLALDLKLPNSTPEGKSDKLISLISKLSAHKFWKEKRHNVQYLDKNFEEAWQIAFPSSLSSKKESNHLIDKYKRG